MLVCLPTYVYNTFGQSCVPASMYAVTMEHPCNPDSDIMSNYTFCDWNPLILLTEFIINSRYIMPGQSLPMFGRTIIHEGTSAPSSYL